MPTLLNWHPQSAIPFQSSFLFLNICPSTPVNSLHTSYDLSQYQHDTAIDLLHVEFSVYTHYKNTAPKNCYSYKSCINERGSGGLWWDGQWCLISSCRWGCILHMRCLSIQYICGKTNGNTSFFLLLYSSVTLHCTSQIKFRENHWRGMLLWPAQAMIRILLLLHCITAGYFQRHQLYCQSTFIEGDLRKHVGELPPLLTVD